MSIGALLLDTVLIVGGFAATFTATQRVVKLRTVEGISMATQVMCLWSAGGWFTYGVMTHSALQMVTNTIGFTATSVVLAVAIRNKALHVVKALAATAGYVSLITTAAFLGGVSALAMTTSILLFILRAPQVWESLRRPGGKGLSLVSLNIGNCLTSCWVAHGFIYRDVWVFGTATYNVITNVFITVRTVQGRRAEARIEAERIIEAEVIDARHEQKPRRIERPVEAPALTLTPALAD